MDIKKTLIAVSVASVVGLGGPGLAFAQDEVEAEKQSAAAANDSTAVAVSDFLNTDNSVDFWDSFNTKVKLDVGVASNEVLGVVVANAAVVAAGGEIEGDNEISRGAMEYVSGITQVSQNSGQNSLTQQSVAVNGTFRAE